MQFGLGLYIETFINICYMHLVSSVFSIFVHCFIYDGLSLRVVLMLGYAYKHCYLRVSTAVIYHYFT